MAERSNADIIRIVEKWQNAGIIHELTCGADGTHLPLEPIVLEGKVVLICPTCKRIQEKIPDVVLGSEAMIDFNLSLTRRFAIEDAVRVARQDLWFAVAVIMLCLTILPGLVGGLTYAIIGGAAGAVICLLHGRHAARKIRRIADQPSSPSESPP